MKKSVTKAREKFITSSNRADYFEVHDDKYYYHDNYICLSLPIIESTIAVKDNGYNFIASVMHKTAQSCTISLDLPTLTELKSYRKTWAEFNKANGIKLPKSAFIYQWADGIALKLDFLILIMEMVPDLVLMAEKADHNIYGYSKSCGAEIVICPVRVPKQLWKISDVHSYDTWRETHKTAPAAVPEVIQPEAPAEPAPTPPEEITAAPEDQTPAEPAAPAPVPAEHERPKAKRRTAPDWVGKTMTAYPRKPKKPEWIGRKMIITIGERCARPAGA
jgi:hypothetical protein